VGRASNRKKARRRAEQSARQATLTTQLWRQEPMLQVAACLQTFSDEIAKRDEGLTAACRAWCGGREPGPAEVPKWPSGSLGDRLVSSSHIAKARNAPCLLTADLPSAAMITADPVQWSVASYALIRAVVFDGLTVDHPAVSTLLQTLGPIAEAELAYGEAMEDWLNLGGLESDEHEPDFPELDGPVFLLGACALVDAASAMIGDDALEGILDLLQPVLDGAVPGLLGRDIADAIIGAFATHYRCEQPGDLEVLERIRRPDSGDPLENLVAANAVSAQDVLPVGLRVLSVLAGLCRSGSVSLLQQVLPAAQSEDVAAAFHENESAAVVGDRRRGPTSIHAAYC